MNTPPDNPSQSSSPFRNVPRDSTNLPPPHKKAPPYTGAMKPVPAAKFPEVRARLLRKKDEGTLTRQERIVLARLTRHTN